MPHSRYVEDRFATDRGWILHPSFDEDGAIQGDSNHLMRGGFVPDVRVPITEETVRAIYVEGRDVALEAAITSLESAIGNVGSK